MLNPASSGQTDPFHGFVQSKILLGAAKNTNKKVALCISEFESRLVYRGSSGTARVTQRPCFGGGGGEQPSLPPSYLFSEYHSASVLGPRSPDSSRVCALLICVGLLTRAADT